MELYDIVVKLAGPILPTGQHGTDTSRLTNLEMLGELLEGLIADIQVVALSKTRDESSIKKLGQVAADILDDLDIGK